MNTVFFGSSDFGIPSLKALIEAGHKISCVVTQPDKKKGRGMSLGQTPIKELAQTYKIPVFQPSRINTPDSESILRKYKPDLFIVIAYGQILSERLLKIPRLMPINAHASYLPSYRGAAPINWAIINGKSETGVSIIKMTTSMDAGPIMRQETIRIEPSDTAISLENKLSTLAAKLLIESIISIQNNRFILSPQDENTISFAPKLNKTTGLIDWKKTAIDINNLIKGCLGWPDAFTYLNNKILKIFKADICMENPSFKASPGQILIVSKEGIVVVTGKGMLRIEELQLEGKKRMHTRDFLAGCHIKTGETLGK